MFPTHSGTDSSVTQTGDDLLYILSDFLYSSNTLSEHIVHLQTLAEGLGEDGEQKIDGSVSLLLPRMQEYCFLLCYSGLILLS